MSAGKVVDNVSGYTPFAPKPKTPMQEAPPEAPLQVTGQYAGLPYVGAPCTIRDNDPENMRPKMVRKIQARQFDLNDPTQLADYNDVMSKCALNHAEVNFERFDFDPGTRAYLTCLRWVESYYTTPAVLASAPKPLQSQAPAETPKKRSSKKK